MSDPITKRPQHTAFRPKRVEVGSDYKDWVINDIRIGNRSQIDPRWYVRLWQRFTWRLRHMLERLRLLEPRVRVPISGGVMDFSVPPPVPVCMQVEHKQIAAEGPGRDAAWLIECRCGWASFAPSSADALVRYAGHKPLRARHRE